MRNAKIMSLCGAAALSILLGGCFTTSDTPFTLVNGDTPHLKTGTLSCKGSGNDAKEERKQFVELRSGANVQYALVGETDTTVEPFVFYQVKGDRYIVVQAGPDSGEVLYVADVTDSAITVFDDAVEAEQESSDKHRGEARGERQAERPVLDNERTPGRPAEIHDRHRRRVALQGRRLQMRARGRLRHKAY